MAKIDDCWMIVMNSLDLRDGDAERNLKSFEELEIENVKLFKESNLRLVRIVKIFPEDLKQKLI